MKRFEGKRAIITGAGSGIGRATAVRLAAEGARVAISDVNDAGLEETAGTIRAAGGTVETVRCDVSDFAQVEAFVEHAAKAFGGIDVIVNVAGIGGFFRTESETIEHWNQVIGVNLSGTFHTIRAGLKYLTESKGNVVNVASIAGVRAHPYAAAYCASKGGVIMLTKALAMEFGEAGIRFNAVCPGGIKTPLLKTFSPAGVENPNMSLFMRMMGVNGRFGRPEEIAGTIAYLASDEASFMTGSIVVNDGGSTL